MPAYESIESLKPYSNTLENSIQGNPTVENAFHDNRVIFEAKMNKHHEVILELLSKVRTGNISALEELMFVLSNNQIVLSHGHTQILKKYCQLVREEQKEDHKKRLSWMLTDTYVALTALPILIGGVNLCLTACSTSTFERYSDRWDKWNGKPTIREIEGANPTIREIETANPLNFSKAKDIIRTGSAPSVIVDGEQMQADPVKVDAAVQSKVNAAVHNMLIQRQGSVKNVFDLAGNAANTVVAIKAAYDKKQADHFQALEENNKFLNQGVLDPASQSASSKEQEASQRIDQLLNKHNETITSFTRQ